MTLTLKAYANASFKHPRGIFDFYRNTSIATNKRCKVLRQGICRIIIGIVVFSCKNQAHRTVRELSQRNGLRCGDLTILRGAPKPVPRFTGRRPFPFKIIGLFILFLIRLIKVPQAQPPLSRRRFL